MVLLINKLLCHYRYDATDRLVGHLESEALERRLFYCESRQVTEMQGLSNRTTMLHGELLLAQHSDENRNRNTALLTTDQQNSVINALQSQEPPSPTAYTPYGHRTIGSDVTSLPGFTGEWADPVTQHYPLGQGHRWFNPMLMRFNSPDSQSPFGRGGLNSYAYCLGDPVNRTDKNGKYSFPTLSRTIGNALLPALSAQPVLASSKTIYNYREIANGISIFDDFHKNGVRLNIMGHGGSVKIDGRTHTFMATADGKAMDAKDLLGTLKDNNVNLKNYSNIRLLSCYLASGDVSFASRLSTMTQKPIKAFLGVVSSGVYPIFRPQVRLGTIDETVKEVMIYKGLLRYTPYYDPIKIYPTPLKTGPIVSQPVAAKKIRQI